MYISPAAGNPTAINDSHERSPMACMVDAMYAIAPCHNDLGSWRLHPNALTSPNASNASGTSPYNPIMSAAAAGFDDTLSTHQQQQQQAVYVQMLHSSKRLEAGPGRQGLGQVAVIARAGYGPGQGQQLPQPLVLAPIPPLPPGRYPQTTHPQHQQVPLHLFRATAAAAAEGTNSTSLVNKRLVGRHSKAAVANSSVLDLPGAGRVHMGHGVAASGGARADSWLGHLAGDDQMLNEFGRIRSTLDNYAQLYHVHQAQVGQEHNPIHRMQKALYIFLYPCKRQGWEACMQLQWHCWLPGSTFAILQAVCFERYVFIGNCICRGVQVSCVSACLQVEQALVAATALRVQ